MSLSSLFRETQGKQRKLAATGNTSLHPAPLLNFRGPPLLSSFNRKLLRLAFLSIPATRLRCLHALIQRAVSPALRLSEENEHPLIFWSFLPILSTTWLTAPSCLSEETQVPYRVGGVRGVPSRGQGTSSFLPTP